MYIKSYGIIETLAPLHVGASAGEETGNLNLIFRDQFTQTAPYTAPKALQRRQVGTNRKVLFFNLGFLELEHEENLSTWIPTDANDLPPDNLVVVGDNDIAMLHDMALYRQSRVKLLDDMKKVDTDKGAFFNVEALPESSILVFPVALKEKGWQPFGDSPTQELYFGGLESIGFGRCRVTLAGDYK